MVIYFCQVGENDDCSSSLFNLKNVGQNLINVFVIEDKENDYREKIKLDIKIENTYLQSSPLHQA